MCYYALGNGVAISLVFKTYEFIEMQNMRFQCMYPFEVQNPFFNA